jgi:S1-C subfamily serine protease
MRPKIPIRSVAPRLAAAGLGVATVMLAAASPAHAAPPPNDSLRQAGVIASPSVVLIEFAAQAYLNDNRDGKAYGPFKLGYSGTGFFVSSDGYVATASHLAALTNDQIKNAMVETYLTGDVNQAGCQAAGDCPAMMDKYRAGYQAATSLSELQSTLTVYTQDMNAASQDTVGIPAQLKSSSPFGQSDIAILKVNAENEPVLPLGSASSVQSQDPVSIIGYPSVSNTGAQTLLVPTVTTGSITALKQGSSDIGLAPGVSIYQTDATIEFGNSGGPAINENGQVVGLVSFGLYDSGGGAGKFLISVKEIQDQVRQAGASNALGQIDHLWRQGLSYFGQHRYVKANAAFQQCVALNKVQVGCLQDQQKAAGLLSQDQEAKYAPAGAPIGLIAGLFGGVILLLLIGAGVMLLMTRRGRQGPPGGQPAADPAQPAAYPPQLPQPAAYPPQPPQPAAYSPQPPQPAAYSPQPAAYPSQPPATPPPPSTSVPPAPQLGFVPPQSASPAEPPAKAPAKALFCSNCGGQLVPGQPACPRCGHVAV